MLAQLGLEGLSGTILMAPQAGDELLGFIIAERAKLSEVWHPDELAFVLSVCDLGPDPAHPHQAAAPQAQLTP